jgi:hypothetical protein
MYEYKLTDFEMSDIAVKFKVTWIDDSCLNKEVSFTYDVDDEALVNIPDSVSVLLLDFLVNKLKDVRDLYAVYQCKKGELCDEFREIEL